MCRKPTNSFYGRLLTLFKVCSLISSKIPSTIPANTVIGDKYSSLPSSLPRIYHQAVKKRLNKPLSRLQHSFRHLKAHVQPDGRHPGRNPFLWRDYCASTRLNMSSLVSVFNDSCLKSIPCRPPQLEACRATRRYPPEEANRLQHHRRRYVLWQDLDFRDTGRRQLVNRFLKIVISYKIVFSGNLDKFITKLWRTSTLFFLLLFSTLANILQLMCNATQRIKGKR